MATSWTQNCFLSARCGTSYRLQVVLRTGSVTSGSVAIQNVSYKREWPMFGHSVWQSLCCLDQNRWTRRDRMLPAAQHCVACGDICYEKMSLNPFRGKAETERRSNFENLRAFYLRIHCFGFRTPVGGEIFRTGPFRPWGPSGLMRNGYRVFSVDRPPPSSVEVKERVELYLYSPSMPSRHFVGRTLP